MRTRQEYRNLFGGDSTDPIWCESPQVVHIDDISVKCVLFDDGQIDYIFVAVSDGEHTATHAGNLTPALDCMRKDLFDPHLRRNKPEDRHPDVHRLVLLDAMTMLM